MEKDKETNLEDWIAKGIKEVGLESPSRDFTGQVLSRISKKKAQESRIIYRPLITKNGWALAVFSVVTIFVLILYTKNDGGQKEQTILDKAFDFLSYDFFSGIHFSDTIVMGMVLFAIFACIQVVTLKRLIERQI